MAKGTQKLDTFMVIEEVTLIDEGAHAGNLLITVTATRGGKEYKRPYMVDKNVIVNTDMDALKQRVNLDLDELEAAASKEAAIVARLKAMQGKPIDLAK